MRQHITRLMIILMLGMLSIGYAQDKKKDPKDEKKSPVKVEPTKSGARASYVPGSVGVYAEGGGRQPSHNEPKGEKNAGAGIVIKFGGPEKGTPVQPPTESTGTAKGSSASPNDGKKPPKH